MWVTILVMAVAISLEPFRIGMTVLMLNRPRPPLQLLAFLCGGFAMGMTVGLIVLFGLRRRLLTGPTHLSLPKIQIFIGVLALVAAAGLALRSYLARPSRRPRVNAGAGVTARVKTRVLGSLSARVKGLLDGRSLWVAGAAGLGIALPSFDYLAVLAVILASGAAAMTQVGALVIFNAVAFALVEIPLLAYLLAPQATQVWMAALNDWIRSRRRGEVATLLAVVGSILLSAGFAGV
jgi:Sap, sulfolipid-1-addressing protein